MTLKLHTILILSLLFLQACDFGCIGGGYQHISHGTDLYVYKANDDLTSLHQEAVLSFSSYDYEHPINHEIKKTRNTIDGTANFYIDRVPLIIEYGFGDRIEKSSTLQYGFPVYHLADNDIDLLPSVNSAVFRYIEADTAYSQYNEGVSHLNYFRISTLLNWDADSTVLDTLLYNKTEFHTDNRFSFSTFFSPRYDLNGDIFYISKKNEYLITTDSTETNYYINSYFSESYLVKYSADDAVLDSLVQLQNSNSTLHIRSNSIAVNNGDSFRIYSKDGTEVIPKTFGRDLVMGSFGSSMTYNNGKAYLRISDKKSINLSDIVPNINFAYPSEKQIAIVSNQHKTLSVFDVETEEIIYKIDIEEIEGIPTSQSKVSTYTFQRPFFDLDSKLKFLVKDRHYFDDPDNECD